MKKVEINKVLNDRSGDVLVDILSGVPEIRFVSKLDEAIKKRGLTQAKLATLTGLRPTTISELINCSRLSIAKSHIAVIMVALRITDIREILDIEFTLDTVDKLSEEGRKWVDEQVVPEEIRLQYAKNVQNSINPDINA